MKRARSLGGRIGSVLGSMRLAFVLLLLLGLLTFLGTLEQVEYGLYDVQKKYFESYALVHWAGPVPIPLPGANLVLSLLGINLFVGGVLRLRRSWATAGILVTHVGIAFLLLSGFVKLHFAEDGHTTLYEGQMSRSFQSYHTNEIAISRILPDGRVEERVVNQRRLAQARPDAPLVFADPDLPFDLEVTHWFGNATALPKGPAFQVDVPVVDGFFLRSEPRDRQSERNGPGAYVNVVEPGGVRTQGMLWAFDAAPWTLEVAGQLFAIDLRRERWPMPFEVTLERFTKVDHPRTSMPSWFSSDVLVREGGTARPVTISMNQPLRERGLVLYQASWGPSNARPGDPLFSTLAVSRNPSDPWPLWSCLVIAAGMLLHFGRKLALFVAKERTRS